MKLSALSLACATITSSFSSDLLRDTLVLKSPQRLATEMIFFFFPNKDSIYIIKLKWSCFSSPKQLAKKKNPAAVSVLHFKH